MKKSTPEAALAAVIAAAGTQAKLAVALGVSAQAVNQWSAVPVQHVLTVERLFGVSRHDQRPDIYPREKAR